ncbi:hypothetical protein SporoP17a_05650 [Sporosarcina ureae]|nr:hypothetical protein SporoP17a_05650 [Sporosarcina ureae]
MKTDSVFHLLPITTIGKKRKRSTKPTLSIQPIGHMMKLQLLLLVQMINNWSSIIFPIGRTVITSQESVKVYECEDCSSSLFRSFCTKAKEGNNRKLCVNEKWERQKENICEKLSTKNTVESTLLER